jgi:hypothetical protein
MGPPGGPETYALTLKNFLKGIPMSLGFGKE